ncbi:hypothetical protein EJ05DRAFT_461284 [Pseudovirgaria hyperparasitica]|uniref:Uncharacterized protein n=1 Tax=Pseudovirgaria hyperparasitica TaxID=470096 RepID=A0A6A6WFF2_9PEZI|nr:uncharacterized protein EJ05DRAFT_461284 [Pseudovirgaria hyperparasitica]KAF2760720.1 hypothetical protein EJ05DRAFT_461284 [Pseudovirgaria hyperparasitica]
MASLRSLGAHTPSALPYLVGESILNEDASQKDYQWETYTYQSGDHWVTEELVWTDYRVVWSQGGVVQKTFDFEIEKQKVVQSVLTWFATDDAAFVSSEPSNIPGKEEQEERLSRPGRHATHTNCTSSTIYGSHDQATNHHRETLPETRSRALVVFLKFQAHLFFLRGSTHVVNLPFEVEKVHATPYGLLLQRRLPPEKGVVTTPSLPLAPNTTFVSSQLFSQPTFRLSTSIGQSFVATKKGRRISRNAANGRLLEDILKSAETPVVDTVPRLFSFTDPLSELGLVVGTNSSAHFNTSQSSTGNRRLDPIDRAEEVIYVSQDDELAHTTTQHLPLILVVTSNIQSRTFTIWNASYSAATSISGRKKRRTSSLSAKKTRRRSSYGPGTGTGTTTPGVRTRDAIRTESGAQDPSKPLTRSQKHAMVPRAEITSKKEAEAAFASQLDPDYSLSQQPPKDSRRVSSLLSRGDVGTSFDHTPFQDLAAHASFGAGQKRGPSFGGPADRMSFGASQRQLRASTPGSIARLSIAETGPDTDDEILDDYWEEDSSEHLELEQPMKGLRREVVLMRVAEVPFGGTAPIFSSSLSSNDDKNLPKVSVLVPPCTRAINGEVRQDLFVYVKRSSDNTYAEVQLAIQPRKRRHDPQQVKPERSEKPLYAMQPVKIADRIVEGPLDLVKVVDGPVSRLISLGTSSDGGISLSLYPSGMRHLPVLLPLSHLRLFHPYDIHGSSPSTRKTAGLKRTLSIPNAIHGFSHSASDGRFNIVDAEGVHHRLSVELTPHDQLLNTIIDLLRFVLPEHGADLILSIWWSAAQSARKRKAGDVHWIALAAALFSIPLVFVEHRGTKSGSDRNDNDQHAVPRTGAKDGTSELSWDTMIFVETKSNESDPVVEACWGWTDRLSPPQDDSNKQQAFRNYIPTSIQIAREFNDSPLGKQANELWRDMSVDRDRDIRSVYLPRLFVALHLLCEEQKLNKVADRESHSGPKYLTAVIAQIGHWLGWDRWGVDDDSYYGLDEIVLADWYFETSNLNLVGIPCSPWESPPSILSWIEKVSSMQSFVPFPLLDKLVDDIPEEDPWEFTQTSIAKITPRTHALSGFFRNAHAERANDSTERVELLMRNGIDTKMLETLPECAVAPLREAIVSCQSAPPTTWSNSLLHLIGRDDLGSIATIEREWKHSQPPIPESSKDYHTICHHAEQHVTAHSSPEHERSHVSRLIFREDRRLAEAAKLLEPLKQTVAECIPEPGWSESEYLDAQKGVMQWVMLRTFALPPGNAMISYNLRKPLLTEKYPLHGFTTSCLMKPMNNIVTADRSTFTEEKFGWAFFHAGVFAGLTISKEAKGIDTSWIVFNKPSELTNKHAGLLLGLGLNGHLRNLAKWLSFKYLTPKHAMTTVGLLLGLAASFIGTMDALVTRLLSVHVTRMLPPGAAELNLSPFTQTTGLMGIGLLYYNTQHRRMSEIMLSEIEHFEVTDPSEPPDTLRDEGYRLAAGFALGLINLGHGNDMHGLHDMRIVERLMAVAVSTKPVDVIHVLDQATAGGTIAVALIFMKTENEAVARKVDIPDTIPQFDYVRPDIFLLRTLAKHVIMWRQIQPEQRWVVKNLPHEYQSQYSLRTIKKLRSEHMPFYNIVAGLLWAVGLKHAGTGDVVARDFLLRYLDQFIRICRLPALRYDAKLARNTVRNCQDLVALSVATVMAGTGDLEVFRRLRALHGRVGPDTPYGSHLAAHFALGALFMAGGTYTFGTSNLAIASLICAFYPLFPVDVLDNKAHLQAFRHFWVLAAEPRCVVVRDVDTHRLITLPVVARMKNGTEREYSTPCLLPELDSIASLRTVSMDYWQVTLDFVHNSKHLSSFRKNQTIRVRRRPAQESHSSVFSSTLAALNESQMWSHSGVLLKWSWIFDLHAFAEFEKADIGLILPPDGNSSVHTEAHGTVLDDRLVLNAAARSWNRTDLQNVKALFAWAQNAPQGKQLKWLGMEVVERLRGVIMERSKHMRA